VKVNESNATATYYAEIDGLRAFAVLSVVIFHAFPDLLAGGFIGVDVFFVISGFLITSHIFKNLDKGQFSFTDFFGKRIRRIFPALILVMAVSLALGWFVLLSGEYAQLGKHITGGATFILNFILVDESGYFETAAETKPMLHLWSLAVEEQFYIIWPLVLWLAWKRRFNLLTITIIVAFISFYLNLRFIDSKPTETFFLPAGRFWELLSGSILAWLLLYQRELLSGIKRWVDKYLVSIIYSKDVSADGATVANTMSIIGVLLLIYGVVSINEGLAFPSEWTLIPVIGALLVIGAGSGAWLNRVLLMNPVAVWFGLISYPLYLWHWPILSYLQIIDGDVPHRDARISAVLLSVLLAWLTYKFIEKPIRFGKKTKRNVGLLVLSLALVGLFGWHVQNREGITPYNELLLYITEAKGDWAYPKGLVSSSVDDQQFWSTSGKPPTVVFLGDSHVEQYGPRIVDLYAKGLGKEAAFITSGGCPPIPGVYEDKHPGCFDMLGKFDTVLANHPIETVVIGGSFNSYLSKLHGKSGKYTYYFKDEDGVFPLYEKSGIQKAKASFYKYVTDLSERYQVVLLLDTPNASMFDPHSMVGNEAKRAIPLSSAVSSPVFEQAPHQVVLSNEMATEFANTKVNVVDPSKLICPDGQCSALSAEGKPIYKDAGHMRPFYVIEHIGVLLDDFVLKK
jgi:peptidoglycan/LPS O-acetylase OafA/YrhL